MQVTILTPYVGQLLRMRKLMKSASIDVVLGERDAEVVAELEVSTHVAFPGCADDTTSWGALLVRCGSALLSYFSAHCCRK